MAEAVCTAGGLATAGACFKSPLFDPHEQKAIIAYLWWKWAESVNTGSAYGNLEQLISASQCITDGLSQEKMVAGMIGVLNRGTDGQGTLPFENSIDVLTADTAATAIKCFKQYDDHTLDGLILFNTCRFFGEISS